MSVCLSIDINHMFKLNEMYLFRSTKLFIKPTHQTQKKALGLIPKSLLTTFIFLLCYDLRNMYTNLAGFLHILHAYILLFRVNAHFAGKDIRAGKAHE